MVVLDFLALAAHMVSIPLHMTLSMVVRVMLQTRKFFLLSLDLFGHIVLHWSGLGLLVKVGLWQGVMMVGLHLCDPILFLWANLDFPQGTSPKWNKEIFPWKLVSKFACFAFR